MADPAGPTVLIVEDDPEVLGMLGEALQLEGYRVATAPDGAAGLALALADPPGLVVTDLTMPRIGGVELCTRLRSDPRTRDSRLLVMTALPTGEARARLAGQPHDGLFAKPFELDALLATVAALNPPG